MATLAHHRNLLKIGILNDLCVYLNGFQQIYHRKETFVSQQKYLESIFKINNYIQRQSIISAELSKKILQNNSKKIIWLNS